MNTMQRSFNDRQKRWKPFSVVIPAHNEQNYLARTLGALKTSIETIGAQGKLIVVDDDSTDETTNIASSHGATIVPVKLRNIGAVRNAGAAASDTEWLFFLDADTLLPAQTLASALDRLAKGDAGGGARVMISPEKRISALKWLVFYAARLGWQELGGWAAGCFMFTQKRLFDQYGGFDEQYFAAEEWFFSRETAKRGRFSLVRNPVVTSARKLEAYSTLELLRFVTLPILRPSRHLKTKLGLELLYDDTKAR